MELGSIQTYSCYSAYYGTGMVKHYAKKAKELGHSFMGVCDRNTMAGLIQLEKAAREHGLKAVHGYDTYLYENLSKSDDNKCLGRILLYAKNEAGFKNLIRINNFVGRPLDKGGGFYYRPRIDVDTLFAMSEGLILVLPSSGASKLLEGLSSNKSKASQFVSQLSAMFGPDFYIGTPTMTEDILHSGYKAIPTLNTTSILDSHVIAANSLREQDDGHSKTNILNETLGVSLESAYVDPQLEAGLASFLSSIQDKIVSIGVYRKIPLNHPDPTGKLMEDIRQGWISKLEPEAEGLTLDQILNRDTLVNTFPHLLQKSNHPNRFKYNLQDYADRLKEEVDVFTRFEKHEYFFPIKLACEEVDRHGKFRGPGRGSGAGCLYSYLLDLTRVDPKPYDLLFSRFFSEARAQTDPPDFDADFSREGRDIVVAKFKKDFGDDRVVKIGTYSRMKTKSAIKNVARSKAYGIIDNDGNIVQYEPYILDRICDVHVTATSRGREELEEMLLEDKFQDFFQQHKNWMTDYVLPLLECITSQSIHAAGVVITPGLFEEELPLNYRNDVEGATTQWEMADLDTAGYLKYDILVVDACSVVQDAIDLIEERHGYKVPSIEEISIADEQTLTMFNQVLTRGVSQYNTFSQMRFFRKMKPTVFDHLVASIALIRPGPISAGTPDQYVRRMHGEEDVEYTFEVLREILEPTYGLMLYQEQMMLISQKLSSFTGVEAEALRKACGKKKVEEMKKWQEQFIERAVVNGHNRDLVALLWEEIVGFAAYSFNLSHSVSYTLTSFYQMWIKARFPTEYWCSTLMHSKTQNKTGNSTFDLKAEAEKEGIEFIFPSVEGFAEEFTVAGEGRIYWPVGVIKGVGPAALEVLTDGGNRFHFDSMEHFVDVALSKSPKTGRQVVTAGTVKSLIKAGFFNAWMLPWEALDEYNRLVGLAKGKKAETVDYEMSRKEPLFWQVLRNEIFGCQVDPWKTPGMGFSPEVEVYYPERLQELDDGSAILIGGCVVDIVRKQDRNRNTWARIKITDGAEVFFVKAWSDWWGDVCLDKQKTRPKIGDIIEVLVNKTTFNERPDLTIGRRGQYHRIVARLT